MTTPINNELQNPIPDIHIEELSVPLREATLRAGWPALMPVQARAIPYLIAGRNMMIQARTGSGKTGAFLLPLLERTRCHPQRLSGADPGADP